jgi:hypothetical protein
MSPQKNIGRLVQCVTILNPIQQSQLSRHDEYETCAGNLASSTSSIRDLPVLVHSPQSSRNDKRCHRGRSIPTSHAPQQRFKDRLSEVEIQSGL